MAKVSNGRDNVSIVFEDMKRRILTLELEPGQALSEADLCAYYSVSRTPMKTVLRSLDDAGYIELSPYQQTRVTRIDVDVVEQYLYARVALERAVIRDFAFSAGQMQLEDMDHVIRKQEIVAAQPPVDVLEFHELDIRLHEVWFNAVGKLSVWRHFRESIDYTRLKILDYKRAQDYELIIREHRALAESIRLKKLDDVAQLLNEHVYQHIMHLIDDCSQANDYFK